MGTKENEYLGLAYAVRDTRQKERKEIQGPLLIFKTQEPIHKLSRAPSD